MSKPPNYPVASLSHFTERTLVMTSQDHFSHFLKLSMDWSDGSVGQGHASKPDDLSLSPQMHIMEEEDWLLKDVL